MGNAVLSRGWNHIVSTDAWDLWLLVELLGEWWLFRSELGAFHELRKRSRWLLLSIELILFLEGTLEDLSAWQEVLNYLFLVRSGCLRVVENRVIWVILKAGCSKILFLSFGVRTTVPCWNWRDLCLLCFDPLTWQRLFSIIVRERSLFDFSLWIGRCSWSLASCSGSREQRLDFLFALCLSDVLLWRRAHCFVPSSFPKSFTAFVNKFTISMRRSYLIVLVVSTLVVSRSCWLLLVFYVKLRGWNNVFNVKSFFLCIACLLIWLLLEEASLLGFLIWLLLWLWVIDWGLDHELLFIGLTGGVWHELRKVELDSWLINLNHSWTFRDDLYFVLILVSIF